jgi:hypothetical protein
MSDKKKQLQRIVRDYQQSGQVWPATAADIAQWALNNRRYDLRTPTILKIASRDIAQAMGEEYITDPKGRRVRAKHPAKVNQEGEQKVLWDDIRTAPRTHMELAFTNRRNHIVGECCQVKRDVDSYNDAHAEDRPIQMVLDFTQDVEELEALNKYNEDEEEEEWEEVA